MTPIEEREIDAAYKSGKRDLCYERGHAYGTFEYFELSAAEPHLKHCGVVGYCRWCGHQRAVWTAVLEGKVTDSLCSKPAEGDGCSRTLTVG